METKHSQRKSQVKLRDYTHFMQVILEHFPQLEGVLFTEGHITTQDVDYLEQMSNFKDYKRINGKLKTLEPITNYLIDNKHMYEWWKL